MAQSHIFYAPRDPGESAGTMAGYEKWDANKAWSGHYYNVVALSHIAMTTGDLREKVQAEAEIVIGERRKVWWERHPNFELPEAVALLKRVYGVTHKITA